MILESRPLTPNIWAQYQSFHFKQGKLRGSSPFQFVPQTGLWLCTGDDALVAGTALFRADGPMLIVDGLVSNPEFSPRETHQAVEMLIAIVRCIANSEGRWTLAFATAKGLQKQLQRNGFTVPKGVQLTRAPG